MLEDRLGRLYAHRELAQMQVAHEYTPYYGDTHAVGQLATDGLLQMYWLASSPLDHIAALLQGWKIPQQARVLDIGCGTGSVARMAYVTRPDVQWYQLGHYWPQLQKADKDWPRVQGDMHALPYANASMQGILLAYVLGYGFAPCVLAEVARVLCPGGTLLWYDIATAREQMTADNVLVSLGYQTYQEGRVIALAQQEGLRLRTVHSMADAVLCPAVACSEGLLELLQEVTPVCYVWEKAC